MRSYRGHLARFPLAVLESSLLIEPMGVWLDFSLFGLVKKSVGGSSLALIRSLFPSRNSKNEREKEKKKEIKFMKVEGYTDRYAYKGIHGPSKKGILVPI